VNCKRTFKKLHNRIYSTEGYKAAELENELLFIEDQDLVWYEREWKEFEEHCLKFARTAELFTKFLGDEFVDPDRWRNRHLSHRRSLQQ